VSSARFSDEPSIEVPELLEWANQLARSRSQAEMSEQLTEIAVAIYRTGAALSERLDLILREIREFPR
jgi:hypothetical protein